MGRPHSECMWQCTMGRSPEQSKRKKGATVRSGIHLSLLSDSKHNVQVPHAPATIMMKHVLKL